MSHLPRLIDIIHAPRAAAPVLFDDLGYGSKVLEKSIASVTKEWGGLISKIISEQALRLLKPDTIPYNISPPREEEEEEEEEDYRLSLKQLIAVYQYAAETRDSFKASSNVKKVKEKKKKIDNKRRPWRGGGGGLVHAPIILFQIRLNKLIGKPFHEQLWMLLDIVVQTNSHILLRHALSIIRVEEKNKTETFENLVESIPANASVAALNTMLSEEKSRQGEFVKAVVATTAGEMPRPTIPEFSSLPYFTTLTKAQRESVKRYVSSNYRRLIDNTVTLRNTTRHLNVAPGRHGSRGVQRRKRQNRRCGRDMLY